MFQAFCETATSTQLQVKRKDALQLLTIGKSALLLRKHAIDSILQFSKVHRFADDPAA